MVRLANRMRKAVPESDFRTALSNVSALLNSHITSSDPLDSITTVMESSGASMSAVEELSSAFDSASPASSSSPASADFDDEIPF